MNQILFHVPHSSLKLPNNYWRICIKDKKYIDKINLLLSDYLIDKLLPQNCHKLLFKYSRIFCDVEKFKDDNKEIMFKKGMGVFYTKYCNDNIAIINKKYKERVLKSYYDKHHNKLNKIVTKLLKNNICIIIDFHSFSDEVVEKILDIKNCPDICIGFNDNYYSEKLINFTVNHFKEYGYSIDTNMPYKGSIIPNKYINKKENNLYSIMLEINKRIYLSNIKKFNKLKLCINDYYNKIKLLDLN